MSNFLRKLISSFIFVLIFTCAYTQKKCGTYEYYLNQIEKDPTLVQRKAEWEKTILNQIQLNLKSTEEPLYIVPVVVHIVLKTPTIITDAQIKSQIDALNRDYRNKNSETPPYAFQMVDADTRIEFRLADVDPNGVPTTGITRTITTLDKFAQDNDYVKYTTRGGKDIWNNQYYLNIWVCDLTDDIVGYSTFPWEMYSKKETDGVVIDYKAFGTIGNLLPGENKGRTAVHEIGHWLGLYHIWGDDENSENKCGGAEHPGSDLCDDTPDQAVSNNGCPSNPKANICDPNQPEMFMNYMDYVNDECMYMFTNGQKELMRGYLSICRYNILTSSGYDHMFSLDITITSDPVNVWLGIENGVKFKATSTNGDGKITWNWVIHKTPNDFSGSLTNIATEDGSSENRMYTTSKSFTFMDEGNYLIQLHAHDERLNSANIDYVLIVESGNPCILSQYLMTKCATQYLYPKGSHLKLEDCSGIYTYSSCTNPWGAQLDQIARVDWLKSNSGNYTLVDQIVYKNYPYYYYADPKYCSSGSCLPQISGCINLDQAGEFTIIHKAYAGYISVTTGDLILIPEAYNTMTKKIKVIDCDKSVNITTKSGLNSFKGKVEGGYITIKPSGTIDINSGETHIVKANREIILKPGLNIKAGSNFSALLEKCPETTCDCDLTKSTGSSLTIPEDETYLNDGDLEVKTYPNPVNSTINIEFVGKFTGPYRIELINNTGIVMKVHNISDRITEIDVEDIPSGLYVLRVYGRDKTLIRKIIKN